MSKRPSFQFYPADWRNNANLRRCSHGARGVWMDILCILHDGDEYGVLRWPLADIAAAANAPLELVQELVAKGVFKGSDSEPVCHEHIPRVGNRPQPAVRLVSSDGGPCWFSSRFVLDEWRRQTKGAATRFTAGRVPDSVPCRVPSQRQSTGSTSTSSSSIAKLSCNEDAETNSQQLHRLTKVLNLSESDFHKQAGNLSTLIALKAEGCDFAADILPAAQRAANGGKTVHSLRYITAAARESRDGRQSLASLPVPFEATNEMGWRERLRVWNASSQWLPKWGPDPNSPDCKCPAGILAGIRGMDLTAREVVNG